MRPRNPVFDDAFIGVYKITAPSSRVYVGMTCASFSERWRGHKRDLIAGRHPCKGLLYAVSKYGIESLEFEILESWVKPSNLKDLLALEEDILKREQYWWDLYAKKAKPYNGRPSGTGSVIHNNETREKLSKATVKNFLKNNENGFYSQGKAFLAGHCANSNCSNFIKVRRSRENAMYCSKECLPGKHHYSEPLTRELLVELHVKQQLHWDDIGVKYGVTGQAIYYWLKKYEIPLRSKSKASRKLA